MDNVYVTGFEYIHIMEMQIWQKMCEHGRARILVLTEKSRAENYYEHVNEQDVVEIYGNNIKLFCGIVNKATVYYEEEVTFLEVELDSTSKLLDCVFENRSYQHASYSYSQIIQLAVSKIGVLSYNASACSTPGLVVQYKETAWQFAMRMALKCNAALFSDVTSVKPKICIGYNEKTETDYIYAGNLIERKYVAEVYTELVQGVLRTTYALSDESDVIRYMRSVCPPALYAGKVMNGIAKHMESDHLQAHIIDVDATYDESGDWYFPYSTAYSSKNGPAGFYVMPEQEDAVRIFFPSENAEEAFAASSVCCRGGMEDYEEKSLRTVNGMQINFTKKGLEINCGSELVSIDLDKEEGISFSSTSKINFVSKDKIEVEGCAGELWIDSEKEIYVGTDASFIKISGEESGKIDVFANKIFVC